MFPFVSNSGILGLNARNLLYIKPYNPRKAVALADDKLKTKAFLAARGVPVAKIYARIENRDQLRTFDFKSLPDECVLKPNYGFGGEGIIILRGRSAAPLTKGEFLEQGKRPISEKKMREHIEDILDGKYSVNGREDTAFFEKILIADPCFAPFHPAGLPDIRIVVFNLVPVMAMLRIPTVESGGKANVHQGGIGIGIDLSKGVTTYATQYNKVIHQLPHGGSPAGIAIPGWEELLLIASRIQYNTNIGYLAVDLTIDADMGPALLEVNARAGLMVQVANLAPLRARLERVGGIDVGTPEKGVRLALDLFGQQLSTHQMHEEDDRPVLGTHELISVAGMGATVDVAALLSPEQERTIFSPDLIAELQGISGATQQEGDEDGYRVKFALGGRKIQTVVRSGVVPLDVRAMIGRRDLTGFLIDPVKVQVPVLQGGVKEDLRAIDRFLSQADHDLLLLKYVKPENLFEERARALEDMRYNPVFQYKPLDVDIDDLEERLLALSPDDSPLGLLLRKKKRELLQRMIVLRTRGDSRAFTDACITLYGQPTSVLLSAATSFLRSRLACDLPLGGADALTAEQALPFFEAVLTKYGLHDWKVEIRDSVVSNMTVGSKSLYLRRAALFSKMNLPALIAHEIETHVLTAENGNHQPYELFRRGFANYMDTQEGLAVYNANRFLSPNHQKRYDPACKILGTAFALEHSFADTRAYLLEELGLDADKALTKAIDMKRGLIHTNEPGGFTRGVVYFRGLRAIEHYVAEGNDLRRLYIGKIALEDLDILEKIPGIKEPLILPEFLREETMTQPKKKRIKKV